MGPPPPATTVTVTVAVGSAILDAGPLGLDVPCVIVTYIGLDGGGVVVLGGTAELVVTVTTGADPFLAHNQTE